MVLITKIIICILFLPLAKVMETIAIYKNLMNSMA